MKVLVIYDNTGKIYTIIYEADETPQGIPCMYVDIPEGAQLNRIDVTDPENPQPVYSYLPESDIGKLQKSLAQLTEELTTTQAALAELYESMEV